MKAYLIRSDGTKEPVDIPDRDPSGELRGYVGGWLECVYGSEGAYGDVAFWTNEEGKLQNLPLNQLATAYWWLLNPLMANVDTLCGDVVVTGGAGKNGETLPISERVERIIRDTYV